jgi:hypothetical protein
MVFIRYFGTLYISEDAQQDKHAFIKVYENTTKDPLCAQRSTKNYSELSNEHH